MQPHDRARRLRQPLERALEIDVRADVDPRLPRLVVELLGLADLIAATPAPRLRRPRDAAASGARGYRPASRMPGTGLRALLDLRLEHGRRGRPERQRPRSCPNSMMP